MHASPGQRARGSAVASVGMAGKSASAAKGRAKLEAFKTARAKKADRDGTVPIPDATPVVITAAAPVAVPETAKPTVTYAVGVHVPPTLAVSYESPPRRGPDLRPSAPQTIPLHVPTPSGSLSSAYAAIADEYLPETRDGVVPETGPEAVTGVQGDATRETSTQPVPSLDPNVMQIAKNQSPEKQNWDPQKGISQSIDDLGDLEPPPFVSPFKKDLKKDFKSVYDISRSGRALEPFAPTLTSTPLLRFETRENFGATTKTSDASTTGRENETSSLDEYFLKPNNERNIHESKNISSFDDFRTSRSAENQDEVTALQKVIEDMTSERLAFQRGLDKQHELMQTLSEENLELTEKVNEYARDMGALRDTAARSGAAIRARDDALAIAVEERDSANATALDAHERARRSAVETVELEEKLRAARNESLRLCRLMETDHSELDRRDRAARAAVHDRDEMANVIEGFRREREFLRAKLRDAARREEQDMERDLLNRNGDSESEDNETPTKETRRQLTLNDTLNDTEQEGTPNENTPGPSGFFHFVSRESRGDESVSANVGNVGEDQLRLVDSIHALLSEVEVERGRAKTALEKTKERVASLERTNAELERRLAGRGEMGKASNETSANRDSDTEFDDSNSGHDDSYIDEDAWSDDEVGTPVRKRGFLSSLNPFGRRR